MSKTYGVKKIEKALGIELSLLIKAFKNGVYLMTGDEYDNGFVYYEIGLDELDYGERGYCWTPKSSKFKGEVYFFDDYSFNWYVEEDNDK